MIAFESEPLPADRASLEMLISDHREFMENTARRQNEVDRVCKARQIKPMKDSRKLLKAKPSAPMYVNMIQIFSSSLEIFLIIIRNAYKFCHVFINSIFVLTQNFKMLFEKSIKYEYCASLLCSFCLMLNFSSY